MVSDACAPFTCHHNAHMQIGRQHAIKDQREGEVNGAIYLLLT